MDILTRFWTATARWTARIDSFASFGAILLLVIGPIMADKGNKPVGFMLADIGLWLGGLALITATYYPDEQGVSRVGRKNPATQFLFSAFFLAWFVLLGFISIKLYQALDY